ncbi:4Fe-4S dicluster domain-containing protein [Mucilaginibacter antarcticus]
MSRHIQFETGMSLTGTNADVRIPLKPSEEGVALINLYNAITGTTLPGSKKLESNSTNNAITIAAKELAAAKGKALVVAGSNDVAVQILVNAINGALGSYGTTIDLDNPSNQCQGNDADFAEFINEAKRGEVGAVLFLNANPVYDYFNAKSVTDALAKVPLKISFAANLDETTAVCNVVAPNHHYLESWGDDNAIYGYFTVLQPTINPVYNTRQAEESLLRWSSNPVTSYYTYVTNIWTTGILPLVGVTGTKGWETLLQTGFVKTASAPLTAYTFSRDLNAVAQTIISQSAKQVAGEKDFELHLYQNNAIRDGRHANNPWLQELPDAVSKVTWDNYAAMSLTDLKRLGFQEGDVITLDANGTSIALPVLLQPGQAEGTISVAVGYGRTKGGKVIESGVGKNAFPLYSFRNGTLQNNNVVKISATGDQIILAQTQTHHSYEGRNVVREAKFVEYQKNPFKGSGKDGEHKVYETLWENYDTPTYNWVMAIDLNACTGCGACVVACNAENNIPVVGRDEVRKRREMHWIRIDRYYSFNEKGESITEEKEIDKLEDFNNVSVVHQPMLCQHCDHAPCETVCPVLATVHSSEGLNHMAYNRCVGTRYCANNCPFKVRRFNWFNYWNDSRFENYLQEQHTQLVLNPDVTTRFRGVMEKCSMCVQRIQAGKLQAKMEKRPVKDGDIQVACAQTCSANAIVFGNGNDPNSEVSKALRSERTYYVLEELNVVPGIGYQVKVRNTTESEA